MAEAAWWPGALPLDAARLAELAQRLAPAFAAKLAALRIADELPAEALPQVYLPLAAWVAQRRAGRRTLLLGINGAQGSGKTTLCALLALILEQGFGLRVAGVSIDDFYLTRAERLRLSRTVHPLLLTRGVPGTHDVALGMGVLDALRRAEAGDTVAIPAFDKAIDDRRPLAQWPRFAGPADVVIFEGWCVAALPQDEAALSQPVNALERDEDADGRWRRYVNERLAAEYAAWFGRLDALAMLKVPSMEKVFQWRGLQESQLAAGLAPGGGRRLMDAAGIRRFVQHYERLTRHMLAEMPSRADVVLFLNDGHQIGRVQLNR